MSDPDEPQVSPLPDRYMMATRASHKTGDISCEQPSLALVFGETDDDYIGQWATGYGFFNVRFPKATTRELTDAEKDLYRGKYIGIAGSEVAAPIRFDEEPSKADGPTPPSGGGVDA